MKTQNFTPSEKVVDQVNAIVKLNREHNAAIRGLSINLFFRDRFTKEECAYMQGEVARLENSGSPKPTRYLLSNGKSCEDEILKFVIEGNYTIAIYKQGGFYRVSQTDNRNSCEVVMKIEDDYGRAAKIAMKTLELMRKGY